VSRTIPIHESFIRIVHILGWFVTQMGQFPFSAIENAKEVKCVCVCVCVHVRERDECVREYVCLRTFVGVCGRARERKREREGERERESM